MDPVQVIIDAAGRTHLVEIVYRKPAETRPTVRLVEPYKFEPSRISLTILCWQVRPRSADGNGWRTFRTDRLISAEDTGMPFVPRTDVTLSTEPIEPFTLGAAPTTKLTSAQRYLQHLEEAILDETLTREEMGVAQRLAEDLDPPTLRAVHGRLYRDVLDDLLMDQTLTAKGAGYLHRLSELLRQLGWAPGDPP